MSLRLVSGTAKGRALRGPKQAGIRPAAARVRKSIFDILGNLENYRILDIFAGTGSMGLEALSRGAESAVFVDSGDHAVALLHENLKITGFSDRAQVLKKTALQAIDFLHRKKLTFDIIFFDPPYDKGHIETGFKKLNDQDLLAEDGIVICEHSPREHPKFVGKLEKYDERHYGQTIVSFFAKPK